MELDTDITPELEAEGFARNISRQVQGLRKKMGLVKGNKVELVIVADNEMILSLDELKDFIKKRTNAKSISIVDKKPGDKKFEHAELRIRDRGIKIFLKRIK